MRSIRGPVEATAALEDRQILAELTTVFDSVRC
jgi:hypothetical protein